MAPLAGFTRPTRLLPSEVNNGASNTGSTFDTLSSWVRFLYEYVCGVRASTTTPQCAPPTPLWGYTNPGHDHSGGVFGVPQKHTVFQQSWGYDDSGVGLYCEAPRVTDAMTAPAEIINGKIGPLWVPPGVKYRNLQAEILLRCTGAGCTYVVTVTNPDGGTTTATAAIGTGNTTVVLPDYVHMVPGALQFITLSVVCTSLTATAEVYLLQFALHQIEDTP